MGSPGGRATPADRPAGAANAPGPTPRDRAPSRPAGHGAGELLMRAVAEAADGKVIRWEVAEANVAAQRFYARIGATLVSKKIGRWQPR
ncbi:GNAT family N-acetyltransferase [Streptosporangium sp. H16]|uniref:GNAT family N-acetyltransferase n=1 Tax=Streptosporangium sp. H16 TaxID=3444184 RepID=UPI003F7A4729